MKFKEGIERADEFSQKISVWRAIIKYLQHTMDDPTKSLSVDVPFRSTMVRPHITMEIQQELQKKIDEHELIIKAMDETEIVQKPPVALATVKEEAKKEDANAGGTDKPEGGGSGEQGGHAIAPEARERRPRRV